MNGKQTTIHFAHNFRISSLICCYLSFHVTPEGYHIQVSDDDFIGFLADINNHLNILNIMSRFNRVLNLSQS